MRSHKICCAHLVIECPNPLVCEEITQTDAILYCHKELDKLRLVFTYGFHHELIQIWAALLMKIKHKHNRKVIVCEI